MQLKSNLLGVKRKVEQIHQDPHKHEVCPIQNKPPNLLTPTPLSSSPVTSPPTFNPHIQAGSSELFLLTIYLILTTTALLQIHLSLPESNRTLPLVFQTLVSTSSKCHPPHYIQRGPSEGQRQVGLPLCNNPLMTSHRLLWKVCVPHHGI